MSVSVIEGWSVLSSEGQTVQLKLVSSKVCRADPPLVQLLCPVQTGRAQHVSISVTGEVIDLSEKCTVCKEFSMPL